MLCILVSFVLVFVPYMQEEGCVFFALLLSLDNCGCSCNCCENVCCIILSVLYMRLSFGSFVSILKDAYC